MSDNKIIALKYKCHICTKPAYTSKFNLKAHLVNHHKIILSNIEIANGSRRPRSEDVIVVEGAVKEKEGAQYINQYACIACYEYYSDLDDLGNHLQTTHILQPDTDFSPPTINELPATSNLSKLATTRTSTTEDKENVLPYEYAVANSFDFTSTDTVSLQMFSNILNATPLQPFNFSSNSQNSSILFASPRQLKRTLKILEEEPNKKFRISTPYTKNTTNNNTTPQSSIPATVLQQILEDSLYKHTLSKDNFEEIATEQIELLNTSWMKKPLMPTITSQLLAGSILVDTFKAIIICSVEAYNRNRKLDAHCESLRPEEFHLSSIPRIGDSVYEDMKFVKRIEQKTEKLIIGTKEMDALVAASLRIDDCKLDAEVGPSTEHFSPSRETRLYLSRRSIDSVNRIIAANQLPSSFHKLPSLKQVRTKFYNLSTYTYCRSHSCFTNTIDCQPYTLFTFANSTDAKNSSNIGSLLFQLVFSCIEDNKKLQIDDVTKLLDAYSSRRSSEVSSNINGIMKLFSAEKEEINILGNTELDMHLRSIATFITSTALASANENVAITIKKVFEKK